MPDTTIIPAINPLQPGAYSAIDASALIDSDRPTLRPVPAILGTCLGGVPNTALYFRGPGPLKQVLRGGIAYDVARLAFAGGAERVAVVRVGNSVTQSSLALAGTTGTLITLTSKDFGSWTTGIKVTTTALNVITITFTDALGNTLTETFTPTGGAGATAAAIAACVNGGQYGTNASQFVTATAGAGTTPLAVVSNSPLAGGTDGLSPANGDWSTGLTALETEDVSIIVPAIDSATIHALALAHANNMSLPLARKERTVVAGGLKAETPAVAAARMTGSLLDKRFQLVYPGIQEFDVNGNLTLYDPFYAAGKLAGLHCALADPAFSLAHKTFPTIDIERRLSTLQGSDVDTLLAAGVTPIAPKPGGGFWVVDSLSGYRTDSTFRDFHKIRSADFVAQYSRTILEQRFVGQKSLSGSIQSIQAVAAQILSDLQAQNVIRASQTPVVTPGANTSSYNVSLPVMLVDATKFIFVTVALQPSSTVNRDAGFSSADANA